MEQKTELRRRRFQRNGFLVPLYRIIEPTSDVLFTLYPLGPRSQRRRGTVNRNVVYLLHQNPPLLHHIGMLVVLCQKRLHPGKERMRGALGKHLEGRGIGTHRTEVRSTPSQRSPTVLTP
jgi:hypothetical protein